MCVWNVKVPPSSQRVTFGPFSILWPSFLISLGQLIRGDAKRRIPDESGRKFQVGVS